MADTLEKYRRKRHFTKTSEPEGGEITPHKSPIFVLQKHRATRLHYDFRLEIGGVLKSWAVPKGPTLDPSEKRLAVSTEDHPIEYADYEGVIPEGEYGAGAVMVWDKGTFEHIPEEGETPEKAVELGHIAFRLNGKKLHGGFALIRTGKGGERWLLIKMKDEFANQMWDPDKESRSALSGRTLDEITKSEE